MPVETKVYERGDRLYVVGPATVFTPTDSEIEEFAFHDELKKQAPNPNLLWMHGQYVEADIPNGNKAMWKSDEIAIKALTPMYMPVTVMHDPRSAVGLIADVKLRTPEADNIPRARIDSSLAVWAHRFPEVAAECAQNAEQGSLMQSMECFNPSYSCAECGIVYHKLPDRAERANWCEHLRGDSGEVAARILERVVFTGVGLIFGTRGITGADPNAHLALEEVAAAHEEFHERQHATTTPRSNSPVSDTLSITRTEYDSLQAKAARADAAEEKAAKLDTVTAERDEVQRKLDAAEVDKKNLGTEKAALETKVKNFEETANQATLAQGRKGRLGTKFLKALPETVKTRLVDEQAGKLTDDEWSSRLEELAALVKVKPEENEEGGESTAASAGDPEFSREQAAQAGGGAGEPSGNGSGLSPARRRSVIGGLAGIGSAKGK